MGETVKRIVSAFFLVVFFLIAFLYSGFYYVDLLLFGMGILSFGLKEFYDFSHREESQAFRGTGYLYSTLILLTYYFQFMGIQNRISPPDWVLLLSEFLRTPGFTPVLFLLILLMMNAFLLQIIKRPLDGAMMSVATTVLGSVYVAIPIGHFFLLLGLPNGEYYVFLVCVITLMCDTGAYFGGRWFGRNPAGLKVSPKKTWEGYITGSLTAIGSAQILNTLWEVYTGHSPPVGFLETVLVSFVFAFLAVIGDLAESALKRDAKIKDSASLIPGHGGVLDLGDALLFTIPSLYYYIKLKEMLGYPV